MFLHQCRASLRSHRRNLLQLFLSLLLLLVSLSLVQAQGVGSTRGLASSSSGSNTIQGRVIFPVDPSDGNRRVKVKLESIEVTVNLDTITDDDGSFRFNQLPAGPYTVVVDAGKEFEPARESITIEESGRVVSVPVYLRIKAENNPAFAGVPKAAVDLYSKAMDAVRSGNSKKAVEHLSSAVALYPKFAVALSELGTQYLKLGQPDKAADALKTATELLPKDFTSRLNYGIALLNKKDMAGAETQLREALNLNNKSATAHMYLGIALLSLSTDKTKPFDAAKYDEARKELETATSTGKDEVAQAHRYLGGIYWGDKNYKRAADEFETYLKLVPKAPDADRLKQAIKDLRSKS